jgi:type I restriction enzyme S subunit
MSDLPRGWEWTTIGEVADVQLGRQRSPKNHSGPHMRPYLRSANVTWSGIDISDVKEMNFEPGEASTFELKPGDLLLNEASGSPNEVGKPAVWRGEIEGCCFQNTLLRVRPRKVSTEYLYWCCRAAALSGRFGEAGRGVNIRHLGKQGLVSFPLAIAPKDEQERVVAAIEEHLSRLDAVATGLAGIPDKLDRFRQVLLRDAFDASWERVPITAVTDPNRVIRYGILKPGDDVEGGVPVVKVRDYPAGEIRVDSLKRTTPEISAKFAGAVLRPGDVLISIRGTFGRVAPVPDSLDGANITQDSARIAPLPSVHRGFLVHFLRSPECQRFLRRVARGVAVKGVNIRDLRMLKVPMPDFETQLAVATRLDDQLSLHGHMSAEIERGWRGGESLRRSILAAAFSGQLVPQDPSNEPAAAFLERIRAERAAASSTKRARKAAL